MAGSEDGIVTVGGAAGIGNIYVFDAETLLLVQQTRSLPNGHYLVPTLYLILSLAGGIVAVLGGMALAR